MAIPPCSPTRVLRVTVTSYVGAQKSPVTGCPPKSVHLSRSLDLQRMASTPMRSRHQVHTNTATLTVSDLASMEEYLEFRCMTPTKEEAAIEAECASTSTSGRASFEQELAPPRVLELHSMEEVEDLVVNNPHTLVVLDCHTRLCGPCKLMEPIYQRYADQFADAIFVRVDTNENVSTRALSGHLKVDSLPAFFAWRGGKLVGQCKGAQQQVLKKMLVDNTLQGEAGWVLPCFRPHKATTVGGGPRSLSAGLNSEPGPWNQGGKTAPA